MPEQNKPHPGTAAVLSFIFSGMGQLYNGQIGKGLIIILISALNILIFLLGSSFITFWILGRILFAQELTFGLVMFFIGLIFICLLGVYSILDAHEFALKQ